LPKAVEIFSASENCRGGKPKHIILIRITNLNKKVYVLVF